MLHLSIYVYMYVYMTIRRKNPRSIASSLAVRFSAETRVGDALEARLQTVSIKCKQQVGNNK